MIKEFSRKMVGTKEKHHYEEQYAEYPDVVLHSITVLLSHRLQPVCTKQKHIGVFVKDPLTTIFVVRALWEIGCTPAIINSTLPLVEVLESMQGIGIKTIMTDFSISGEQDEKAPQFLDVKMMLLESIMMQVFMDTKLDNDPAIGGIILFTSGTTEKPKAVLLEKENLLAAFSAGSTFFRYKKNERWLLSLPVYHVGGFSIFFRAFIAKQILVIPQGLDAESVLHAANMEQVHYISLVPTQLYRILKRKAGFTYKPKAILLGGAGADYQLIHDAMVLGLPVFKVLGATETCAFHSVLAPKYHAKYPAATGLPIGDTKIVVRDVKKKPCGVGQEGEIYISSSAVAKGYLKNPKRTRECFVNSEFKSGDTGYVNAKGIITVTGRIDDIINSGGEKISPAIVLKAIQGKVPEYSTYVFGAPDAEWGEAVSVLLCGKRKPGKKAMADLQNEIRGELSGFQMPKHYYFTKINPVSEIEKINKQALQSFIETVKAEKL